MRIRKLGSAGVVAATLAFVFYGSASFADRPANEYSSVRCDTTHGAAREAGSRFRPFKGTGQAFAASGDAMWLGFREFGQSLTGRQNRDLRTEQKDAMIRAHMHSHAAISRNDFGGADRRTGTVHCHSDSISVSRGGGPIVR